MQVQILLPELTANRVARCVSFNRHAPGQLLLVVTPGSVPGGRWFDSNPRNFTEVIRPDEEPVSKTGAGYTVASSSLAASAPRRIVPWSSGNDSCPTPRQRRFNSVRDYFCPATPIGRAARLKPECLQVRLLLWAQVTYVLAEQSGVLATLSRWRSSVQIRSGTPFQSDQSGAVRKQAKRRSSNLRGLWVRLPPVLLKDMRRLGIGKPQWL